VKLKFFWWQFTFKWGEKEWYPQEPCNASQPTCVPESNLTVCIPSGAGTQEGGRRRGHRRLEAFDSFQDTPGQQGGFLLNPLAEGTSNFTGRKLTGPFPGQFCTEDKDCFDPPLCGANGKCSFDTCTNGFKDDDEVDVDCGNACPLCLDYALCTSDSQCRPGSRCGPTTPFLQFPPLL
jgi:hypothetical protein